jgi:PE family
VRVGRVDSTDAQFVTSLTTRTRRRVRPKPHGHGRNSPLSFVNAYPEALAAAAGNLQSIGAALNVGTDTAAGPTTGVVPAAADEVSALTAAQFAAHGARFQELSARAARIQAALAATLAISAGSYAATEAANAASAG